MADLGPVANIVSDDNKREGFSVYSSSLVCILDVEYIVILTCLQGVVILKMLLNWF